MEEDKIGPVLNDDILSQPRMSDKLTSNDQSDIDSSISLFSQAPEEDRIAELVVNEYKVVRVEDQ